MTATEPFATDRNGTAPEPSSWTPLILTDLPNVPPIQPTLGALGFLYPKTRHVFTGPQESAKTLAAYAAGILVIRNHHGPVLIIDFEMGSYNARNRLRELGATDNELAQMPYLEPHEPATVAHIQALVALQPGLVIIDAAAGAYDLHGLDDNKRQDVGRINALYVDQFWQNGISTIFLDHVVKNVDNRGNYAIGSERKVGACDVHLGFEVVTPISRGTSGLYKIHTRKDRYGFLKRGVLAEMNLDSDPDTHQISWEFKPATPVDEDHPWMPTKVMQKVSALLERQSEPIGRNQIATEIGGRKDIALKAIDALVRTGYAHETDGPNRTKLASHTRPFTVLQWEAEDVVPTGSAVVPGTTTVGGSSGSPPYGGTEPSTAPQNHPVVPELWSWVDELSAKENGDPPGDLHDPPPTPF